MFRFVILFLFCLVSTAVYACRTTIVVKTQTDFDALQKNLTSTIKAGKKNIYVKLMPGTYRAKEQHIFLKGITAADTKIHILGDNAILIPSGREYHEGDVYQGTFSVDNSWMSDSKDLEIWSHVHYADSLIEILDEGKKLCRLKTKARKNGNSSNQTITQSSNSYILIPHWFKSSVYKIDKIEGRYIYFTADDLNDSRYGGYNVNDDYNYGKKAIRYKLCNVDVGEDCLRISEGRVHLPRGVTSVWEGSSHSFMVFRNCVFASIDIEGIQFWGNAYKESSYAISIKDTECKSIRLHGCGFRGMRGNVINVSGASNVRIDNNQFEECYRYGIRSSNESINTVVENNHFESMGKAMLNTKCVRCQGANYRVANNVFVNFGYGGISTGVAYKNKMSQPCSGVIENNDLSFDQGYLDHIDNYGIMDGGAIYVATKTDGVVIRNNYIHGFSGMKSNRGIMCDDGAYNIEIYGNAVTGIVNSWCIDSRRVKKVERSTDPESTVDRANVNIVIRDNYIDGGLRFEANEGPNNGCIKGTNYIIPGQNGKKPRMEIGNVPVQKDDVMLDAGTKIVKNKNKIKIRK